MIRVFLGASVLFTAAYSATGASREIVRRGIRGQVALVASDLVLKQARRNLEAKAPEAITGLEMFQQAGSFEMIRASRAAMVLPPRSRRIHRSAGLSDHGLGSDYPEPDAKGAGCQKDSE